MITEEGIAAYRQYVNEPWGKLFYRILHAQLEKEIGNQTKLKILDFGSGFGITADYFSKSNKVVGVEPDKNMIKNSIKSFEIIEGNWEVLADFEDAGFDMIFCHNVFEYVEDKECILKQFCKLLKKNGKLSIVKHNIYGKVNALAVFNENPKIALELLMGKQKIESDKFGQINYYEINTDGFKLYQLKKEYGIRIFWGNVYRNEIKYNEKWNEEMFELEMAACENKRFIDIASWNHLILQKLP